MCGYTYTLTGRFLFSTQVSVIQYAVDAQFEFKLRDYNTKKGVLEAVSKITQMTGSSTNTFHAISYAWFVLLCGTQINQTFNITYLFLL